MSSQKRLNAGFGPRLARSKELPLSEAFTRTRRIESHQVQIETIWRDSADRFGTPQYCYDLDGLRAAYIQLREALPPTAEIYYSLKANPHPSMVDELGDSGAKFEVSSARELALVEKFGADRIFYTGPARDVDENSHALAHGVRYFSVESLSQLAMLDLAARSSHNIASVVLRVATDHQSGGTLRMSGRASQFGMSPVDALSALRVLQESSHTRFVGLHLFSASNVPDEQRLLSEFEARLEQASSLLEISEMSAEVLFVGGGFSAPWGSADEAVLGRAFQRSLTGLLDGSFPGWRSGVPRIAFESGRALANRCGTLLARVVDVKESRGSTFALLESGINHLSGMGALRRSIAPQIAPKVIGHSTRPEGRVWSGTFTLTGPLCTPTDIIGGSVVLDSLRVGDLIAIPSVGGYGLTASMVAFLSRDAPVEVSWRGGEVISVDRLVMLRGSLLDDSVSTHG